MVTNGDEIVTENKSDKALEETRISLLRKTEKEEQVEEEDDSPAGPPANRFNKMRRRSSKTAKMEEEDEVFEKARNMLTDSDNSQSPPANWINKLRHRSSKIDELPTGPENQPHKKTLPVRLLRRASSLLQEKLDAVSDAVVNYAEESYATANNPESANYRTPEEKFILHQINGGDIVT